MHSKLQLTARPHRHQYIPTKEGLSPRKPWKTLKKTKSMRRKLLNR